MMVPKCCKVVDITLQCCYDVGMKAKNNIQPPQRMSVYFPPELLEKAYASAKLHRRSFNQEMLWFVEQCTPNVQVPDNRMEVIQAALNF